MKLVKSLKRKPKLRRNIQRLRRDLWALNNKINRGEIK
jgi:hypothetical protein